MIRVYFAAPLFNDMERRRNVEESGILEQNGCSVFLPQRDAGQAAQGTERLFLFNSDIRHLTTCDVVFAYVDGRVPDEGMAFEMGYAYALGKPVYIISTDSRDFMAGHMNNMLEQCSNIFSNTLDALHDYIESTEGGDNDEF